MIRARASFTARLALVLGLAAFPVGLLAQDSLTSSAETTSDAITATESLTEDTVTAIDYVAWERVAQRAEKAVEAGRASDQALTSLRSELNTWRETFANAKAENQVRINTLQTQIATLGPAPADGATEPAILTLKRDELTLELQQAQAPAKDAELARARANALIGEIDSLLRARQADALTQLGPTPLNPSYWPGAIDDLFQTVSLAWYGVKSSLGTETQRAELMGNIPVLVLFIVVAFALLLRGRGWVMQGSQKVQAHARGPARGVWGFLLSFGQIVVPLIGVFALVQALNYAGILGLRAQVIVDELPMLGLSIFVARWLANRLFGTADATVGVLNLPPATRAEGRREANALGLVYGLHLMLGAVATYEGYPEATLAVLDFPLLVIGGVLLLRLGQIMRRHAKAETEATDDGTRFVIRVLGVGGSAMIFIGVAGPVAAAIGYGTLAERFIYPTALTAGLGGFLIVLHRFFLDLYGLVFGRDNDESANALLPVLASFVVALLLLPVLALIWGMRVTDLTEIWTRINEGVAIGDTVISPSDLLTFAVIFAIGYGLTRLIQGMLKTTVLPKTRIDLGGQNAISSGIGYLGLFLAAVTAITAAGIDLSSLAIVAGALSVGIGFGLQNIVSNFVSGIILLIERPISEGDWIEVGGQMGTVRDISVRSTRIETFDRSAVILPNSDLISGVVTNYTRQNLMGRVIVPVGVAYGTDTKRVETILNEIANAHPLVALNPAPSVLFREFGADSLNFEIRAILRNVNFILDVQSDMNHEIARRFAEEGIEIPFAQRDIWLRNPEALQSAPPAPARDPVSGTPDTARSAITVDDMQEAGSGEEAE